MIFVLEGFRTNDHDIAGFQNSISFGDKYTVIALDDCDDDPLWQMQIRDAVICPVIMFVQPNPDKMHIFFLTVFSDTFQS